MTEDPQTQIQSQSKAFQTQLMLQFLNEQTIETANSNSDNSDESNIAIGFHRLSKKKRGKIFLYLQNIQPTRASIIKGLKYAFINIDNANEITSLISKSFLINTSPEHQLSLFFLLNDILFNAQNIKIKYSWVYTELIQSYLPNIFQITFAQPKSPSFILKINELLELWCNEWNIFNNKMFYNGLFWYTNSVLTEGNKTEYYSKVKQELWEYENELFNLYTNDKETELRRLAKENGICDKMSYGDIIIKLWNIKEMLKYKEWIKEFDGEECDEEILDNKIKCLNRVLAIMRKGFAEIDILDANGVVIDKCEYEYFNLDDLEVEECWRNDNNCKENNEDEEDWDGEPL